MGKDRIALHNFSAKKATQISFSKGDVITNVQEGKEGGWWTGEVNGKTGSFPSTYTKESDDGGKKEEKSKSKRDKKEKSSKDKKEKSEESSDSKASNQELDGELKAAQRRNSDLEADKKSLEARVERLHNEMEYTNKELTMLRAARDDAENLARKVTIQREAAEGELESVRTRAADSSSTLSKLRQELDQCRSDYSQARMDLNVEKQRVATLESEVAEKSTKLTVTHEQLMSAKEVAQTERQQFTKELNDFNCRVQSEVEKRLSAEYARRTKQALEDGKRELHDSLAEVNRNVAASITELNAQLAAKNTECNSQAAEISNLKKKVEQLEQEKIMAKAMSPSEGAGSGGTSSGGSYVASHNRRQNTSLAQSRAAGKKRS
eukprot:TRINITY_DN5236_c0_g1_i1.p1 TRINITY_DN5236_c0_g1~~TRINITY_DN5236_c0_g1_i1.p1  ORF type:complete len:378 (+),score=117.31 TRINITY_DN5236_c0_g1_i1:90-1223(+)